MAGAISLFTVILTWLTIHELIFYFIQKGTVKSTEIWNRLVSRAESGAIILSVLVFGYQVYKYGYEVDWLIILVSFFTGLILGLLNIVDRLANLIQLVFTKHRNQINKKM